MNIENIKKANTKILGKKIEYYQEIESTHIQAKNNKENDNGKIIIAEIQTGGIGTKGRSWYTGKSKNIAMTIILKPKCKVNELDGLTIKIAECMKKAIKEKYGYELKIKKPNDLLLNNKKICGILTQSSTIGEKLNYLLISLGFNVNEDSFPEETIEIATSLKKEFKKEFYREDVIIAFIEELEKELKNII